jgi:hypothetical protein
VSRRWAAATVGSADLTREEPPTVPIYEVTRTSRVYSDEVLTEQDVIEAAATSTEGLEHTVTEISEPLGLDAQISACWDRLHAEHEVMYELTLRRIARDVLAKHPTAATLRLVIRYPDEIRLPVTWQVDHDADLLAADGQPVPGYDPAELDDEIGEDLLTLGEMDEVHTAAAVDLRANPPELTVPDDASPGPAPRSTP